MLEHSDSKLRFSTKNRKSLTDIERKLLEVYAEPLQHGRVSIIALSIMGLFNGLFGNSGTGRIRINAPLTNTVFVNKVALRYWLLNNARVARYTPKLMEYYAPPEDFCLGVDDYLKLVPDLDFFDTGMDLSKAPGQVTFLRENARLEIVHQVISKTSCRSIRLQP